MMSISVLITVAAIALGTFALVWIARGWFKAGAAQERDKIKGKVISNAEKANNAKNDVAADIDLARRLREKFTRK